MMIKNVLHKLFYGNKSDSDSYVKYLKKIGVQVGERVKIFAPMKTLIDETRPWMISIGDDVQITEGVKILTHGYDWSVLKGLYGDILGSSGQVKIGNNVFIGMNTTILKGVNIGDNVIIGAASLVSKDIPDNSVAVGNPARVIMTIAEYHQKRQEAQIKEATELVRLYRERYGKEPDDKALHEFFWLFTTGEGELPKEWKSQMALVGNETFSYRVMRNRKPIYENKDQFLTSIK